MKKKFLTLIYFLILSSTDAVAVTTSYDGARTNIIWNNYTLDDVVQKEDSDLTIETNFSEINPSHKVIVIPPSGDKLGQIKDLVVDKENVKSKSIEEKNKFSEYPAITRVTKGEKDGYITYSIGDSAAFKLKFTSGVPGGGEIAQELIQYTTLGLLTALSLMTFDPALAWDAETVTDLETVIKILSTTQSIGDGVFSVAQGKDPGVVFSQILLALNSTEAMSNIVGNFLIPQAMKYGVKKEVIKLAIKTLDYGLKWKTLDQNKWLDTFPSLSSFVNGNTYTKIVTGLVDHYSSLPDEQKMIFLTRLASNYYSSAITTATYRDGDDYVETAHSSHTYVNLVAPESDTVASFEVLEDTPYRNIALIKSKEGSYYILILNLIQVGETEVGQFYRENDGEDSHVVLSVHSLDSYSQATKYVYTSLLNDAYPGVTNVGYMDLSKKIQDIAYKILKPYFPGNTQNDDCSPVSDYIFDKQTRKYQCSIKKFGYSDDVNYILGSFRDKIPYAKGSFSQYTPQYIPSCSNISLVDIDDPSQSITPDGKIKKYKALKADCLPVITNYEELEISELDDKRIPTTLRLDSCEDMSSISNKGGLLRCDLYKGVYEPKHYDFNIPSIYKHFDRDFLLDEKLKKDYDITIPFYLKRNENINSNYKPTEEEKNIVLNDVKNANGSLPYLRKKQYPKNRIYRIRNKVTHQEFMFQARSRVDPDVSGRKDYNIYEDANIKCLSGDTNCIEVTVNTKEFTYPKIMIKDMGVMLSLKGNEENGQAASLSIEAAPIGSYLFSCKDITINDRGMLRANCASSYGGEYNTTELEFSKCGDKAGINNRYGTLICNSNGTILSGTRG